MSTPLLELSRVSVQRDGTKILDDLSLSIPRGRHTALLGPNGSGKTSLLKLLTRQFYPSVDSSGHQGQVSIMGERLFEVSRLHRRMGIVSSGLDHSFSDGQTGQMTASEAVASGITATQLKQFGPKLTSKIRQEVQRSLDFVGMGERKHQRLQTMSTGERRRVLIARATVHRPEIFVLDEPTSGLDIAARTEVLKLIDVMTRSEPQKPEPTQAELKETDTKKPGITTTMVLVTHHIDEIPPSIDHVLLLESGRVIFDGPKKKGLTEQRLSSLFKIPIHVQRDNQGWYRAETTSNSSVQ